MAFARLVGAAEQHVASGDALTQGRGRSVKKAAEDASAAIEAVEDFAEGSLEAAMAVRHRHLLLCASWLRCEVCRFLNRPRCPPGDGAVLDGGARLAPGQSYILVTGGGGRLAGTVGAVGVGAATAEGGGQRRAHHNSAPRRSVYLALTLLARQVRVVSPPSERLLSPTRSADARAKAAAALLSSVQAGREGHWRGLKPEAPSPGAGDYLPHGTPPAQLQSWPDCCAVCGVLAASAAPIRSPAFGDSLR